MLFNLEKFNKEISELKNLKTTERLHPLKKEKIKQSVLKSISEAQPFNQRYTWQMRLHRLMRYIIATLLGLSVIGGTAFASGSSKPGDILFPVKKATEAVRLKLATSDSARAELQAKFAEERLRELGEINNQMHVTASSSPASQKDMQAKIEAKDEAETEVNNALNTLQQVKVDLESKGNSQAAQSVEKTIIKLQSRPIEKSDKDKDKKETDQQQSEDGNRGPQSHGSGRMETALPIEDSATVQNNFPPPASDKNLKQEKQQSNTDSNSNFQTKTEVSEKKIDDNPGNSNSPSNTNQTDPEKNSPGNSHKKY